MSAHGLRIHRQLVHRGPPAERVLMVCGDVDSDGDDEIITGGRVGAEGLHLHDRQPDGSWRTTLIDDGYARLEAGGYLFDIDGDGRLDLVAGSDGAGAELMWWRNQGDGRWQRRRILRLEGRQSHDQAVVSTPQGPVVVAWNQGARRLIAVPVPRDPMREDWPHAWNAIDGVSEEGLTLADLDGDGIDELLAGLSVCRPDSAGGPWRWSRLCEGMISPRLAVADFDCDGALEIAISEGDSSFAARRPGRLAICRPGKPGELVTLRDDLLDPHTLLAADLLGIGRPQLFAGELGDPNGHHPRPLVHLLCRFEQGRWRVDELADEIGAGIHEGRLCRVGGRLHIAGKPYRNNRSTALRVPEVDDVSIWTIEESDA